ncbi:hypothetical protein [Streptomyces sp. NPDC005955]|uniref:hypothetical protein n=1 Tax=Streptomyces sp. NPDC005955 TaxID=3364738 RepID=UPI00369B47A5
MTTDPVRHGPPPGSPPDPQQPPPGERPLLTLRVSRDGGRTWGDPQGVYASTKPAPILTSVWPTCACPRCAARA